MASIRCKCLCHCARMDAVAPSFNVKKNGEVIRDSDTFDPKDLILKSRARIAKTYPQDETFKPCSRN